MSNKPQPWRAFTGKAPQIARSLLSPVQIGPAFNPRLVHTPPSPREYMALWDTGATHCTITEKVVRECGLHQIGVDRVFTADGSDLKPSFLISFMLPNHVGFTSVRVTLGKLVGADMLIGMDIISRGDFAVSNFEGKTVYSFRIPSYECIDFVAAEPTPTISQVRKTGPQPARNSQCPCGSGKKFKHCCGR